MMRSFRKNLNVILIVVVAAFAVTIFYGYGTRMPARQGEEAGAAAQVNNTAISFNDLNAAFQSVIAQYDQTTLRGMDENSIVFLRRLVLENMINNELLYQEAQDRRIRVTDAEVNEQVDQLRTNFPTQEEWNRFLQFQNLDLRRLRDAFRRELMIQSLSLSLGSDIVIPDENVLNYYEENRSRFTVPARYSVMQITVPTREQADDLLTLLYLGRDFMELAREHSTDPFRDRGGERGWVSQAFMEENAWEAISGLDNLDGGLTAPVQGDNGFTIYQVTEYQPSEETSFEDVQDQIRDNLRSEQERVRVDLLLSELRGKAEITLSEVFLPETSETPDISDQLPESLDEQTEEPATDGLEPGAPKILETDPSPEISNELIGEPIPTDDPELETPTITE